MPSLTNSICVDPSDCIVETGRYDIQVYKTTEHMKNLADYRINIIAEDICANRTSISYIGSSKRPFNQSWEYEGKRTTPLSLPVDQLKVFLQSRSVPSDVLYKHASDTVRHLIVEGKLRIPYRFSPIWYISRYDFPKNKLINYSDIRVIAKVLAPTLQIMPTSLHRFSLNVDLLRKTNVPVLVDMAKIYTQQGIDLLCQKVQSVYQGEQKIFNWSAI